MTPWTLPTRSASAAAWHVLDEGCYLALSSGGGEPVTRLLSLLPDGAVAWDRELVGTEETRIAADPSGRLLATGGSRGTVDLRRADGALVRRLRGPEHLGALAFDAEGARLVSAAGDRVRLWETDSGRLLLDRAIRVPLVLWARWSPAGDALALGGKDGGVEVLAGPDLAQGRLAAHHEGNVWACAWDPEDRGRLATGGWDRTVRIWDGQTGALLRTLDVGAGEGVEGLAWISPGRLISLSTDGQVHTWDPETGARLGQVQRARLRQARPRGGLLLGITDEGFEVWDPLNPAAAPEPRTLPAAAPMDYRSRDPGQPRARELTTTVRDAFRVKLPPVFGDVLRIPVGVARSILSSAVSAGVAMRPSHPGFAQAAEAVGWHWEGVLRALHELPPCRAWAVEQGLTPGIVYLPLEGDTAWFGARRGSTPRPIAVPPPGAFVLSYGYQDLALARRLQGELEAAGLPTFVLDATPGQEWDAVWWLRFRTAMATASHVLPLLSADYLAREGTRLEYGEMQAMFDRLAEDAPLSPVLPLLGAGAELALSRDAAGLFGRLPALEVATEQGRARLVALCQTLVAARAGDLAPLLGWLRASGAEGRPVAAGDQEAIDFALPAAAQGWATVRYSQAAGQVRWMAATTETDPVELPRRRAPDLRTEKEVVRAAAHGVPDLVHKRVALAIAEEGADYSLLVRLGEALDDRGHGVDALVVLREAWAWAGGVTWSGQRAKIQERLDRLDRLAAFAGARSLTEVLERHGGRVPSPFKLEAGAALGQARERTGFEHLWQEAHRALQQGDVAGARATIAYAYNSNASDAAQSDLARLSAKIAQALGDRDTALAWLLLGLDWSPTSPRTRADVAEGVPRLLPWKGEI